MEGGPARTAGFHAGGEAQGGCTAFPKTCAVLEGMGADPAAGFYVKAQLSVLIPGLEGKNYGLTINYKTCFL